MSTRSPSNSKSPSSRNRPAEIVRLQRIHPFIDNEEDLELDNEDGIIIPYEILNPK
jgi:hypothetical protein